MTYKVLIFDFFGVICSEVAPFWLARYLPQPQMSAIKARVVHAADLGEMSQDDMFAVLSKITGVSNDQIEREWLSFVRIDSEVVDFIVNVKPKHRLGLLTNSPSPFVRGILKRYHLSELFDSIVVSSEHHCAKPDPAIYERILNDMSVKAADALMIDDNLTNVTAAISVGMNGIVFQSCDQLKSIVLR